MVQIGGRRWFILVVVDGDSEQWLAMVGGGRLSSTEVHIGLGKSSSEDGNICLF